MSGIQNLGVRATLPFSLAFTVASALRKEYNCTTRSQFGHISCFMVQYLLIELFVDPSQRTSRTKIKNRRSMRNMHNQHDQSIQRGHCIETEMRELHDWNLTISPSP